LSLGALVAGLAAYKDLAGPWKELLGYYQTLADTRVKYQAVVEQFDLENIYPPDRLDDEKTIVLDDSAIVEVSSVAFEGEGAGQDVVNATAQIEPGAHVAVIGGEGSGRETLMQLVAGLVPPTSGRVTVGGHVVDQLREAVTG